MEASRWGGRIVVLSVLSMLLAIGSVAMPYYEVRSYDMYLTTELNSGPAETLNGLANATLGLLVIYAGVALAYIVTVMRGVKWMSLYLGGASCVLAVFTATYFVFQVGQTAAIYDENNYPQEWNGSFASGFVALLCVIVAQFFSAVLRGWVLGGRVEKRLVGHMGDRPLGDDDLESSPLLPR
jgi:hypothetical protein